MAELKKIIVDGVEYTLPEGGGGSGASSVFEDVNTLPENPSDDVIYSLLKVFGIINQYIQTNPTVHIVDTLPTTGNVCTNDGSNLTDMYYNRSDNNVYGYVNDMIGSAFGIPAGWYNAEMLLGTAGVSYGGVVDSIVGLEIGTYYFVREYDFYVYKGKWIKLDNDIVFQGEGESAVVMNYLGNVASGDYSHAEGMGAIASGENSHAEGYTTTASGGYGSHAEGNYTTASGENSHSEGRRTIASGSSSHAEGDGTTASGMSSHAEGVGTIASGYRSHAECSGAEALGDNSHAEGTSTTSGGYSSHSEGFRTTAVGDSSHAEGIGDSYIVNFIANYDGSKFLYYSNSEFKCGEIFFDSNKHYAKITSASSTTFGNFSYVYEFYPEIGVAGADQSGNEVPLNRVYGIAYSRYSHSEGKHNTASGDEGSHAEGWGTIASGYTSHSEGNSTEASGNYSHAEGGGTIALGHFSHSEGNNTEASGDASHAEGHKTMALGNYSHAEGDNTIASGDYSHVEGKFNREDTNKKYAHIVGNGYSHGYRSNAHTLDWDGNAWFAGKVRVGGASWDTATELGSGGGGSVFEDVTALPDNPDEQKIYRVKTTDIYKVYLFDDVLKDMGAMAEQEGGSFNFIVVDSLPDNPKDAMDESGRSLNFYIVGEDVYAYNMAGDNTWLSNNELAIMMGGAGYGGFITSTDDTSELTTGYLYLQRVPSTSYSYVNVVNGEQFEFASKDDSLTLVEVGALPTTPDPNKIYKVVELNPITNSNSNNDVTLTHSSPLIMSFNGNIVSLGFFIKAWGGNCSEKITAVQTSPLTDPTVASLVSNSSAGADALVIDLLFFKGQLYGKINDSWYTDAAFFFTLFSGTSFEHITYIGLVNNPSLLLSDNILGSSIGLYVKTTYTNSIGATNNEFVLKSDSYSPKPIYTADVELTFETHCLSLPNYTPPFLYDDINYDIKIIISNETTKYVLSNFNRDGEIFYCLLATPTKLYLFTIRFTGSNSEYGIYRSYYNLTDGIRTVEDRFAIGTYHVEIYNK